MPILKEILIEELQDLLHAEGQLVKALPKMARAAKSPSLKAGFEKHLEETRGHVARLQQVFELLGVRAKAKPCKAMQGLVEEGAEKISEGREKEKVAADLGLIGCAQKVEHYEISGYGTVRTMAEHLGQTKVARLLAQNLAEEEKTDKTLTQLAVPLLQEAAREAEQGVEA